MKYCYPVVLTKTEDGYEAYFPDMKGCATFGENLQETLLNAEDALALVLWDMEEKGDVIPAATSQQDIICSKDQFVNLVAVDTLEYRREYDQKAVKKTLTIPRWLDTLARRRNVNFSGVLQQALLQELRG